jgi:hypothetical protein
MRWSGAGLADAGLSRVGLSGVVAERGTVVDPACPAPDEPVTGGSAVHPGTPRATVTATSTATGADRALANAARRVALTWSS